MRSWPAQGDERDLEGPFSALVTAPAGFPSPLRQTNSTRADSVEFSGSDRDERGNAKKGAFRGGALETRADVVLWPIDACACDFPFRACGDGRSALCLPAPDGLRRFRRDSWARGPDLFSNC
jgi:hypothetical protein